MNSSFNVSTSSQSLCFILNLRMYSSFITSRPGVGSLIPARPHTNDTFLEIDLEMFSTAIPLSYADSFKKGCCQLQGKVYARSVCNKGKYVHEGLVNHVNHLFKLARGKRVFK